MKNKIFIFVLGTILGFCSGAFLMRVLMHNTTTKAFNSCEIFQKLGTDELVEIVECFNKSGI